MTIDDVLVGGLVGVECGHEPVSGQGAELRPGPGVQDQGRGGGPQADQGDERGEAPQLQEEGVHHGRATRDREIIRQGTTTVTHADESSENTSNNLYVIDFFFKTATTIFFVFTIKIVCEQTRHT